MKTQSIPANLVLRVSQTTAAGWLALAFSLAATAQLSALTLHRWTGGSATSGNWSAGANWLGGVAPSGGDQRLIFDPGAARKLNTNNLASGTTFESIWISDGGYNIYGNRVRIDYLRARCTSGTSTTFRPDILASGDLQIINELDATTFHVLGDLSLVSDDLLFPSFGLGDVVMGGVIGGAGDVFKQNASGNVSFSGLGANTYVGTTYVSAGVLRLNRYNLVGLSQVGTVAIPGDLSIGSFASTIIDDLVILDNNNQIANTSTVSVLPTGALILGGDNDTIGELRLSGGTVSTTTGSLGVEGGIHAIMPIVVSKNSLIAGRLTLGARGAGPQLIDVTAGVQLTISAQISGPSAADLVKTNRGDLILTASNIFSGDVVVVGGTVNVQDEYALGNTTGITRLASGTIVLHGVGVFEPLTVVGRVSTLTVDSFGASWNGSVILNDDLTISVPTNRTLSITGQMSGPAGWTKNGPGTFTIRSTFTHSYAGAARVNQGRVFLENVSRQVVVPGPLIIGDGLGGPDADIVQMLFSHGIGDASPVTINNAGVLLMVFHDDTIGSLAGSGHVNLGSGTLTVGANHTSTLFSGVISGTGSLVKTGSAALTLTGNNTYTGVTTNQSGTLLVDGVLNSSTVRVHAGAVLGGNGQVQSITSFANGEVSPGASPGRLTVQGQANLANSDLRIELNGTAPATQYDQLRVNGNVDVSNARLFFFAGFPPTTNDTFVILDKTSPGPITGFFLNTTEGSVMGTGFNKYRITYQGGDGNDVVLRRVEIPGSNISGISAATDDKMQITGQGVPFVTYILEATPTLSAPIPWTPIATNSANALGIYKFIDAYADGGMNLYPVRFYRVLSP